MQNHTWHYEDIVLFSVKCDADLVLKAAVYEKNGVKFMKFTNLQTNITIKDYHIRLDGLFNGDKVLGEALKLIALFITVMGGS
jgi:hypothetical protein